MLVFDVSFMLIVNQYSTYNCVYSIFFFCYLQAFNIAMLWLNDHSDIRNMLAFYILLKI